MSGLFTRAVVPYFQAGWPAILPIPPGEKGPPPTGYTGDHARDTDPEQLAMWGGGSCADFQVGLRMPDGVIGIDVDHYWKGTKQKQGAVTLAALIERLGPLPATWTSTARGSDSGPGVSCISFYRVPLGRRFPGGAGADVDVIQRHHRYIVAAPSINPDTGTAYRWYGPDGAPVPAGVVPKPSEFPMLPDLWLQHLGTGSEAGPPRADYGAGMALIHTLWGDERPPCVEVANAFTDHAAALSNATEGGRHDAMIRAVHRLVHLGAAGHPGVGVILENLREAWHELTSAESRGEEFQRALTDSARKAVHVVGAFLPADPCLLAHAELLPAPAPDTPEGAAEPIAEPAPFSLYALMAQAGPFDPTSGLDQTLAQDVLARVGPFFRYATDTGQWLQMGRDAWSASATELASSAISLLAWLMPDGDPDAHKEDPAYARAQRRKRMMTSAPAGAIARKMTSLVVGGGHPAALRLAELDIEPAVLWAGGVPWDLTQSELTPTGMHPWTPHLHSAAVGPADVPTPRWDAFCAAVWPDPALRAWALRVLSIALTGYPDAAMPILLGDAGRGKTQLVSLVMSVLGSYAHAADPRLLASGDSSHASIVYALRGRRLSFIDEGPRQGALATERLKQLTGGGQLTGNAMRTDPVVFTPTHTLILTANEEPTLTDPALRRRARIIPCVGDPAAVREARMAIGPLHGSAWRSEAPGVLAALMHQAAGWLADRDSALAINGPAVVQTLAEDLAAEQDPLVQWLDSGAVERYEPGTRARELYRGFVGWCRDGNIHQARIPSETKWGRAMTTLGYPPVDHRDGRYRELRIRSLGGVMGVFSPMPVMSNQVEPNSQAVVETRPDVDSSRMVGGELSAQPSTPQNPRSGAVKVTCVDSVDSSLCPTTIKNQDSKKYKISGGIGDPTLTIHKSAPDSGVSAGQVLQKSAGRPTTPTHHKLSPEDREARKLAAAEKRAIEREAKRVLAVASAQGDHIGLPAAVLRDGRVFAVDLPVAAAALNAIAARGTLDVDVEHTGYPVGHRDYALRTVQLGDTQTAIVLDASSAEQMDVAAAALSAAGRLGAFSAAADLVPLAVAGVLDISEGWAKMHDRLIPAKLADPTGASSDAGEGLKQLSVHYLGPEATAPAAEQARKALFRAGKWLEKTEPTTPIERGGWANVSHEHATMIRYDGCDVLDTALLGYRLPAVDAPLHERERAAQRMTGRVAYEGLPLRGEHIAGLIERETPAMQAAHDAICAYGIDNPGSNQQLAGLFTNMGVQLPPTDTGKPSVAAAVMDQVVQLGGQPAELARLVLDYRKHETALGTFLRPYDTLVRHGDGRARPTVYTLEAATGRMSCVRPNLQQVPREGGYRACIGADPGNLLLSVDFSSVEFRVAAAVSGDDNLIQMLQAGLDVHALAAEQVYGAGFTKAQRYNVKRGVFGWLYGGAIGTLAAQLKSTDAVAQRLVDVLTQMTPRLVQWRDELSAAVKAGQTQYRAYSGRIIHLRKPHSAPNYVIQGTARELLVDALIKLERTRYRNAVILPVHDEILMQVPEQDAEQAQALLLELMSSTLAGVQIKAEANTPGTYWKDSA